MASCLCRTVAILLAISSFVMLAAFEQRIKSIQATVLNQN